MCIVLSAAESKRLSEEEAARIDCNHIIYHSVVVHVETLLYLYFSIYSDY